MRGSEFSVRAIEFLLRVEGHPYYADSGGPERWFDSPGWNLKAPERQDRDVVVRGDPGGGYAGVLKEDRKPRSGSANPA